jgi:hypothetical protein
MHDRAFSIVANLGADSIQEGGDLARGLHGCGHSISGGVQCRREVSSVGGILTIEAVAIAATITIPGQLIGIDLV